MKAKRYPARNNWRVLIPARFTDTGKQQARFFDSKTEAETEIRRILNRGNSSKPKVSEADEAAFTLANCGPILSMSPGKPSGVIGRFSLCLRKMSPKPLWWRALINVYGANSLSEVVQFLRGEKAMEPVRSANGWACAEPLNRTLISGSSRASSMSNALSKSPLPAVTIFSALDLFRRGLTPLC